MIIIGPDFKAISPFLRSKRAIYAGTLMARANRHYIPGHIWHTPVKYALPRQLRL